MAQHGPSGGLSTHHMLRGCYRCSVVLCSLVTLRPHLCVALIDPSAVAVVRRAVSVVGWSPCAALGVLDARARALRTVLRLRDCPDCTLEVSDWCSGRPNHLWEVLSRAELEGRACPYSGAPKDTCLAELWGQDWKPCRTTGSVRENGLVCVSMILLYVDLKVVP